jgi:hypothetical protein
MNDKIQLKKKLFDACSQIIDERISTIESSLKEILESRNAETKSSAGDKYETGRAMLQIEEDNYKKQLHQAMLQKNQLLQTVPARSMNRAHQGSLVTTNQGHYFICIGLGAITVEKKSFFCISAASPIGQKIIGQGQGYRFEFNGNILEIQEIY